MNKTSSKWNSGLVLLKIGWGLWIPLQRGPELPCRSLCSVPAACDRWSQPPLQQHNSKGSSGQAWLAKHSFLTILVGIFPQEFLVHTHFYWYFICGCVFIHLHAQPWVCSVGVTCFALSAGSFSYFFLWEHAVIAPVFQRACNPKSVRRKYFFKEENVVFVNFLNLSSIQLSAECTSKLVLGLGWDFCWFHFFKQELTRGMSKFGEVPSPEIKF